MTHAGSDKRRTPILALVIIVSDLYRLDTYNQARADMQQEIPKGVLSLTIAIGSVLAMLGGLLLVFARLKQKDQGFGPSSLKAIGLVLFIPTLVMVAVAVPEFKSETLAALLGTVAGYVLSHSKGDDS